MARPRGSDGDARRGWRDSRVAFVTVDIPLGDGISLGASGSTGVTFGGGAPVRVTDFTGKLIATHLGSGTTAQPAFKIELALSSNAVDCINSSTTRLGGVVGKLQAGKWSRCRAGQGRQDPAARAAAMEDPTSDMPRRLAPSGTASWSCSPTPSRSRTGTTPSLLHGNATSARSKIGHAGPRAASTRADAPSLRSGCPRWPRRWPARGGA